MTETEILSDFGNKDLYRQKCVGVMEQNMQNTESCATKFLFSKNSFHT